MRALSGNTRKATAVTLAAALVIAVYLNWQYARSDVPAELESTAAVAAQVEDVPVQADAILDELPTEAEAVSSANKNYGEAQLVSVASDSGAKFFEQARLKRQKAHDEAMDSIKKTMKASSLSAEEKKEYTSQLTANLEDLNAENEIETLIRAKGFADCLCFLQSGRADLTVMSSGQTLTAAQVAQIRDVVLSKSSVTAQNITVVEVKEDTVLPFCPSIAAEGRVFPNKYGKHPRFDGIITLSIKHDVVLRMALIVSGRTILNRKKQADCPLLDGGQHNGFSEYESSGRQPSDLHRGYWQDRALCSVGN